MRFGYLALIVVLTAFNSVNSSAAMYEPRVLKLVPIERVLNNLNARLLKLDLSLDDRAMLEFQIGRLHSMAYAEKNENLALKPEGDSFRACPYAGSGTDYQQFRVNALIEPAKQSVAAKHLEEAIVHLRRSVAFKPKFLPSKLGLAWCLDQAGEKSAALPLYREVFKESYALEKDRGGMSGRSAGVETAGYLLKLLDPKNDACEIVDVRAKSAELERGFASITPLVVPLHPDCQAEALIQPGSVRFDLDGFGIRTFHQWPGRQSGWLVYDADRSGSITSGLQMFGQSTFWIFWRDGYEALSALDANDDGIVEGAETDGLAVWTDLNCNGKSDPGEVRTLKQCGIESLSCRGRLDASGLLFSENGVSFCGGGKGDSYDLVLQGER